MNVGRFSRWSSVLAALLLCAAMGAVVVAGDVAAALTLAVIVTIPSLGAAAVVVLARRVEQQIFAIAVGIGLAVATTLAGMVSYGLAVVPALVLWIAALGLAAIRVPIRIPEVGAGLVVGLGIGAWGLIAASRAV